MAPSVRLREEWSTFVGREADLQRLGALLSAGHRLVTLVGAPGSGKTRLAHELARRQLHHETRTAGFCWVDLADARTRDDLCHRVCATLGSDGADDGPFASLTHRIPSRLAAQGRLLLILDNLEQLVGNGHDIISAWLAEVAGLRVLVTSQERLKLPGEHVHAVDPLPDAEAVDLFAQRAAAACPGFELNDVVAADVRAIARQLDGLPLALELAAARVRVMAPAQLLERLKRGMDVLPAGDAGGPPRHATLRAAISWAWSLLSPPEQQALAQCSVFRGGFTLDAAEAVVVVAPAGTETVLDLVQSLVDKSLLQAAGTVPRRLRALECIRDFARGRLAAAGVADATETRHAAYFTRRTRDWAQAAERFGGGAPLDLLVGEHDNLAAVLRRSVRASTPDADTALQAALALDVVFRLTGRRMDGHAEWVDRAVVVGETADHPLLAALLVARAGVARAAERLEDSVRDCERAARLGRDQNDNGARARAQLALAITFQHLGRHAEALTLHRDALAVFEQQRDLRLAGFVVGNLALLEQALGHADQAGALFERSLQYAHDAGHGRYEAIFRGFLGMWQWERGLPADARASLLAATAGLRDAGDQRYRGYFTAALGGVEAQRGDDAAARRLLEEARTTLVAVGDSVRLAAVDLFLGHVDIAAAQRAAATRKLARARALLRQAHARVAAAPVEIRSDEVRLALRLLRGALERSAPEEDSIPAVSPWPAGALVVSARGTWVRTPSGQTLDLGPRHALRQVLLALVAAREDSPASALSARDLLAAGWPGERVLPDAGNNRVYVAVTTLRKLGLSAVLVRNAAGYLLDPLVPLVRAGPDPR